MLRRGQLPAQLFERVLSEVPAILNDLWSDDKVHLAATCWGALEAVLRGSRTVLAVHPDDPVLHVLARQLQDGPCTGLLGFCGVQVPATCAGALLAVMRELGDDLPTRSDDEDAWHCKWIKLTWALTRAASDDDDDRGGLRLTGLEPPGFFGSSAAQVSQMLLLKQILQSAPVRGHLRHLRLSLDDFSAGDEAAAELWNATRGLAALEELKFSEAECVGEVFRTRAFGELGSLACLDMHMVEFDADSTRTFYGWVQRATKLRRLTMYEVWIDPDAVAEFCMSPPACLEEVDIYSTEHPFKWRDATHVRSLALCPGGSFDWGPDWSWRDELAEIGDMMRRSTALRELRLLSAETAATDFEAVFTALAHSTVEIFECNWGSCGSDDDGGGAKFAGIASAGLVAALQTSKALRVVDVSAHVVRGPCIIDMVGLALAMEHNTTLRSLRLSALGIGDDEAVAIQHILETNTSLVGLAIESDCLSEKGIRDIAAGLLSNHTLQRLRLEPSREHSGGAIESLARALVRHDSVSRLRRLDLSPSDISDMGARHLADCLKDPRCTLHSLRLDDNNIGDAGAAALASALAQNTSLVSLSLRGNEISSDGTASFAQALEKNSTLQTLRLDSSLSMPLKVRLDHARKYAIARRQLR